MSDYRVKNTSGETLQIVRINLKLAKNHRKVCTSCCRGEVSNFGDHYLLDQLANMVIETHVNLDEVERRSA